MWIVAKEDKYVASTWGASVSLKANEPKQVAKDLGLLCLQHGCEEVQGGIKEEPIVKEAPIEEVIEETSKDLESMTKVELEEYGRTIGVELDRRKKKSDLIEELKQAE
jgi:hypothetical protein